jgi:hypothetical protein
MAEFASTATMGDAAGATSVLRRLLDAAEYRLVDRAEGLLAVRPRDHRSVLVISTLRSPAELEGFFPADSIHRTIVYAEEPGAVARSLAAERGIELLDPTTLGPALGELLLPSPVSPAEEAAPSSTPGPAIIEAPPALLPEGLRTVRPRFSGDEAEAIAGVEGFRVTLRLIPFWVAAYRVRAPAPHGGVGLSSDHLAAVNALSRRVEIWEPGERELISEITTPHEEFAPEVDAGAARTLAEQAIRRRHVINVDHTEQHDGALIIETRRVAPRPNDVGLGPVTLLHVPYWYIEGTDGRVVVDAVNGARLAWETPRELADV